MSNRFGDVSSWQALVIEDSRELADIVKHLLTGQGAKVYVAPTGADAYDLLTEISPTFILLDLKLPDTDGFTVMETVRSQFDSDIPIIAFTARAHVEAKELIAEGFDGFVLKPFRMEELIDKLQNILQDLA
jgi:DNA-binding response OmpR family regulator